VKASLPVSLVLDVTANAKNINNIPKNPRRNPIINKLVFIIFTPKKQKKHPKITNIGTKTHLNWSINVTNMNELNVTHASVDATAI